MRIERKKTVSDQRNEAFLSVMVPMIFYFILVLAKVIPTKLFPFLPYGPDLMILSIYYFAVFRPDFAIWPIIVPIGLLEDIFDGKGFGIKFFIYFLIIVMLHSNRRYLVELKLPQVLWLAPAVVFVAMFIECVLRGMMGQPWIWTSQGFLIIPILSGMFFPLWFVLLSKIQSLAPEKPE